MDKERLRDLIVKADDPDIKSALWELYDLKFSDKESNVIQPVYVPYLTQPYVREWPYAIYRDLEVTC